MKGKFCSVGLQCSLQFQLISSAVGLQSSWRGEHNWIQPLHCPVFPLLHLPAKQASFCLGNKTSLQTQDGSKSVPDSLGLREGANLKAQISPDSVRVDSFPAAHDFPQMWVWVWLQTSPGTPTSHIRGSGPSPDLVPAKVYLGNQPIVTLVLGSLSHTWETRLNSELLALVWPSWLL